MRLAPLTLALVFLQFAVAMPHTATLQLKNGSAMEMSISEVHATALLNEESKGVHARQISAVDTEDAVLVVLLTLHFPEVRVSKSGNGYSVDFSAVEIPLNTSKAINPLIPRYYSFCLSNNRTAQFELNLLSDVWLHRSLGSEFAISYGFWGHDPQYLGGNVRFGIGYHLPLFGRETDLIVGTQYKYLTTAFDSPTNPLPEIEGLPTGSMRATNFYFRIVHHIPLSFTGSRFFSLGIQVLEQNRLPQQVHAPVSILVQYGFQP